MAGLKSGDNILASTMFILVTTEFKSQIIENKNKPVYLTVLRAKDRFYDSRLSVIPEQSELFTVLHFGN